ncbi:MAG TPA: DUF504 domain-containing protein [Methanoregulaceae archaeon]|nr:DUF504 domain-containing protein [Methanoregulaceae archaeon]
MEEMRTSHILLLKYFHDPRYVFSDIEVCYIDRGAPGDVSCIRGSNILNLDSYYFETEVEYRAKAIPYHRICRIKYRDEIVWSRNL